MTTLNDALVTIIQKTQGAVESGVSFLSEQIPDVIQQLLMWKVALSATWLAVHILLFIIGIVALRNAINVIYEQLRLDAIEESAQELVCNHRGEERQALQVKYSEAKSEAASHVGKVVIGCIVGVILTVSGVASFCLMWSHLLTIVQIYIAPKVWLIEYAASIVK